MVTLIGVAAALVLAQNGPLGAPPPLDADVLRDVYSHRLDLTPYVSVVPVSSDKQDVREIEVYERDVNVLLAEDERVRAMWASSGADPRRPVSTSQADDPVAHQRHAAIIAAAGLDPQGSEYVLTSFELEGDRVVSYGLRRRVLLDFPGRTYWRGVIAQVGADLDLIRLTGDPRAGWDAYFASLGIAPAGQPPTPPPAPVPPGPAHPGCEAQHQAMVTALQALADHMARWPLEAVSPGWYMEWYQLSRNARDAVRAYNQCVAAHPLPPGSPAPVPVPEPAPVPPGYFPQPPLFPIPGAPPSLPCKWRDSRWPSVTPAPIFVPDPDCGCVEQWVYNMIVCGRCNNGGVADRDACEDWAERQLAWCLEVCQHDADPTRPVPSPTPPQPAPE